MKNSDICNIIKKSFYKLKGVIKIEKNKTELALYVINLKIANEIKNNTKSKYEDFKANIDNLNEEKEEIYKNNEKVIEKVLNIYLEELKR